jgi:tetratricopeptide (TPR) repeat protein
MRFRSIAFVLLLSGCAARGPSPQLVAEMAKAKALLSEGCYTCLTESLAIYEKQLAAKKPMIGAREGAFDAAILIALREKELAIPSDASMAKARSLVTPLRQQVLDAAELVIGDTTALDPEQRALFTGRNGVPALELDNPKRRALDAAPQTDLAAKYVGLSMDCEQPKLIEGVDAPLLAAQWSGVPLMLFRLSICGRPKGPLPGDLRAANPKWTDTLFWEGRRALAPSIGQEIDFPLALGYYGQGRTAFPTSVMLTMAFANTSLSAEEFEGALAGFDDVIKTQPMHRDALNGRMQSLSYLMRHEDAIAAATRLLDLGTWHISDANYWRAWNRYQIKGYDAAWVDVENAIKGLSNGRVFMLAGLIAYARKDLPIAVQRFDRAYEVDSSQCDATWMSGLVSIDQNEFGIAAPKFTRGMSCFVKAAAALRKDRTRLEQAIQQRGTPATARDQRTLDRLQRDADNAEEKSAQSAFNGAGCYARIGMKTDALTLVAVAVAHPKMNEKAVALKAAIEKMP